MWYRNTDKQQGELCGQCFAQFRIPWDILLFPKFKLMIKYMYLSIFMLQTKTETRSNSLRNYILCFTETENLDSDENIIVGGDFIAL